VSFNSHGCLKSFFHLQRGFEQMMMVEFTLTSVDLCINILLKVK